MAQIEGWLVLTPKKHVYFHSDRADRSVLELPWQELEDEGKLVSFLDSFKVDLPAGQDNVPPLPVKELTEIRLVIDEEELSTWFKD